MSIQPWKILDSKYLLQEPWMTVRSDQCETDQGVAVDAYYVHESCDWVHVLAFDDQMRILLTKQYRHGISKICWELPAGCVDNGESPLAAMQRELLEETGCVAGKYQALPKQFSNPARCNNYIHPFVALHVKQVSEPQQEAAEHIEFTFMPIPELLHAIEKGEFRAALHIGTIYMGLASLGLLEPES